MSKKWIFNRNNLHIGIILITALHGIRSNHYSSLCILEKKTLSLFDVGRFAFASLPFLIAFLYQTYQWDLVLPI